MAFAFCWAGSRRSEPCVLSVVRVDNHLVGDPVFRDEGFPVSGRVGPATKLDQHFNVDRDVDRSVGSCTTCFAPMPTPRRHCR